MLKVRAISSTSKWDLTEWPLDWIQQYSSTASEAGSPVYYAAGVVKAMPSVQEINWTFEPDSSLIEAKNDINGLALYPPADGTYTIEIVGYFYSKELIDAEEDYQDVSNWWSANHPELVMLAIQVVMGNLLNNKEGTRAALENLRTQLSGLIADDVEQDSYNKTEMLG